MDTALSGAFPSIGATGLSSLPTAGVQPVPDIAAKAKDTGEATPKVAESDRLYEIVEPTENRARSWRERPLLLRPQPRERWRNAIAVRQCSGSQLFPDNPRLLLQKMARRVPGPLAFA
jgi:hypothetical protein